MHKPESDKEKKTHKIPWDFEIQRGHLIPIKRPDLIIINKKRQKEKRTSQIVDFAVQEDHKVKKKTKKKKEKQVIRPCQRTKNVIEHESDGDTNYDWCTRNDLHSLGKATERAENRKTCRDYPNNNVTKIARILRRVLET